MREEAISADEVLKELDRKELKRLLGKHLGCTIEEVDLRESRPLPPNPGLAGDKLICEATMRSQGRETTTLEFFVKRMLTSDHREARLYEALHSLHFPLPEFYGHYLDEAGREVLILEYIPRVGFSYRSEEETADWLSLMARLNAMPLNLIDEDSLSDVNWATWLIDDKVESDFDAVIQHAADSLIGDELASFCKTNESKIRSLPDLARRLHSVISGMPKALCNEELQPGWRSDGTLVAFDLHSTRLAPRCLDISNYIGEPESQSIWGRALSPRMKWAQVYGNALEAAGGPSIEPAVILQEAHLVWMAFAFQLAWCLQVAVDGQINWFDDPGRNKAKARTTMLASLACLVEAQEMSLV